MSETELNSLSISEYSPHKRKGSLCFSWNNETRNLSGQTQQGDGSFTNRATGWLLFVCTEVLCDYKDDSDGG